MSPSKLSVSDLVVAIYDAALEPTSWSQCYDNMREFVGADSMLATLQYPASGEASLLASNLDPRFLQEYVDGWWIKDAWGVGALGHPRGIAYVMSELVPDPQWMRSEIYNELVKVYANCRYCLGTIVNVDGGRGGMGFHRPANAPDFTDADRRLFQELVPHIHQALRVGQRLAKQDNAHRLMDAAIDALSFGLIVVDRSCHPLLMNRSAEECLRGGGQGLSGGRSHQPLRTESAAETRMLQRLVHEATAAGLAMPGAMRLTCTRSDTPLMLLISPLIGKSAGLLQVSKRAAVIFVLGLEQSGLSYRMLRDLFGLTPAEATLAGHLVLGARLEDVALQRNVKPTTLRTHLNAIFQKTGTNRQSSLVRLLERLSVRIENRSE